MLRALASHPAAQNLDDDCAVLRVGSETLVLTLDAMAERVHWLPGQDMADVAWKLVACNISDLAAKGAEPLGVLLGYTLGGDDERFVAGLGDALSHFGVPLLGGDTIRSPGARTIGLTAIGRATHLPVPARTGAWEGDELWLTGPLGAAMTGFEALRDGTGEDSLAYRRPEVRLAEGIALAPHVTAMMDVSDGLLLDAARMARASGVAFAIDSTAVPVAVPEVRRADALRWGDDYELLFTAPADADLPVFAHRIGIAVPSGNAPLVLDGKPLTETDGLGYEH